MKVWSVLYRQLSNNILFTTVCVTWTWNFLLRFIKPGFSSLSNWKELLSLSVSLSKKIYCRSFYMIPCFHSHTGVALQVSDAMSSTLWVGTVYVHGELSRYKEGRVKILLTGLTRHFFLQDRPKPWQWISIGFYRDVYAKRFEVWQRCGFTYN